MTSACCAVATSRTLVVSSSSSVVASVSWSGDCHRSIYKRGLARLGQDLLCLIHGYALERRLRRGVHALERRHTGGKVATKMQCGRLCWRGWDEVRARQGREMQFWCQEIVREGAKCCWLWYQCRYEWERGCGGSIHRWPEHRIRVLSDSPASFVYFPKGSRFPGCPQ